MPSSLKRRTLGSCSSSTDDEDEPPLACLVGRGGESSLDDSDADPNYIT